MLFFIYKFFFFHFNYGPSPLRVIIISGYTSARLHHISASVRNEKNEIETFVADACTCCTYVLVNRRACVRACVRCVSYIPYVHDDDRHRTGSPVMTRFDVSCRNRKPDGFRRVVRRKPALGFDGFACVVCANGPPRARPSVIAHSIIRVR